MASELIFVFCYDVASEKVRRRIAALLEDKGVRVQKSVFEVRMSQERAETLLNRLALERHDGDSVRMYCLDEQGRARSRAAGGSPIPERTEFWLF